MKKIISLLSILLVVFLLCACGDTPVPSTSSTEESQQSATQSSVIDTNDKDTEEGKISHELSLTTDFVMDEFYPMIDCGRFEAADFAHIALNTYEYRIIDTHEELIAKTSGGAGYSSTIFEENVVLALHTYRICDSYEAVGYYDFTFDGKRTSIKTLEVEPTISREGEIVRETVYLLIPKEDIVSEESSAVGGLMDIQREEVEFLQMMQIPLTNSTLAPNTAYLLEEGETTEFLSENGVDILPQFEITEAYKVIARVLDVNTPASLGYNVLSSLEGHLSIERLYKSDAEYSNTPVLELIAIPKEMLASESYTSLNFTERMLICHEYSYEKIITNTVIVNEKSDDYYDLLDLGIYYYDSQLPKGMAYHIITSKSMLDVYVENPYLEESYFENNYVVVLRLDGYSPLYTLGIRRLVLSADGVLTVYMDDDSRFSRRDEGELNKQEDLFEAKDFQSQYCYVSVPKDKVDIMDRGDNIGSAYLVFSNIDDEEHYYTTVYGNIGEGYTPSMDFVWIVVEGADAQEVRLATGIDVSRNMKKGEFLLVYYGKAPYDTRFLDCQSNENNVYIEMNYIDYGVEYAPRLYVTRIPLSSLNCTEREVTVHLLKYRQQYSKVMDAPEKVVQYKDSFFASYYEGNTIAKVPKNEYTIIESQKAYEEFLAEHTNFEVYPSIDFEIWNVIAYYQYEPCTACDSSTAFCNVRVGDRVMYIDKRVEEHMGGAAMNPTIYFIAVEKSYFEGGIDTIYFIEKHYVTDWYGKYPEYDLIESEHLTLTFTTSDGLSAIPDFSWKLITSKQELDLLYEKYTGNVEYGVLDNVFDSSVVLAICYKEGYDMLAYGGFKDFTVKNNTIYITKYYPQYKHGEDEDIVVSGFACTVLHLVVVERCFIPEEITDVVVFMEL